ncbi:ANTAR domain-containing protein [Blastococcus sp. LR1]|uniref:ANTAR domain-containing protein n=1 Tax=Blastococcus sp. LR1 TaxID=2877000 RepID=UPI001CCAEECA|nr:ANTAR domain-containing protein [Blastococcus sp. LR1]MCA0143991.1 ANTAR domain-containing protein [Blastococcus sp. LR1]
MAGQDAPLVEGELARVVAELEATRAELASCNEALKSCRRIGIAMGILMERYKLTDQRAFELLRRTSQRRNVKLRDIAYQFTLTGSLER